MAKPVITLTILTSNFAEFVKQAKQAEEFLDYIQIDVMDGKFVNNISFPERAEINDLHLNLKLELHLMVSDPIEEMRKWRNVNNVFRVIFHFEAATNPLRSISFARKEGWDVGLAINPDTVLEKVKKLLPKVDLLLFMTVYPGAQGAQFEPKVLKKIKEFIKLKPISEYANAPVLCAVDGGVNKDTIKTLRAAGVEIFNVGSYLTKANDLKKAYQELTSFNKIIIKLSF